jgi:hypothetical protein
LGYLLCVLAGIGCAMAFVVSGAGYVGLSDPPAASTSPLWGALSLVFSALFGYVRVYRGIRLRAAHVVLGLVFGMANYFGTTLFAYDTWDFLASPLAWGRAFLQCLGQGLPMVILAALVDEGLREGCLTKPSPQRVLPFPRLARLYREHTVLLSMGLFVLCWAPYLLVYYPGSLSWDIGEMLAQFNGLREMDTWHPVFLTWVVGACLWLGRLLKQDNLGMALFTLLQTAALAYALGYLIRCLRRMGANRLAQGLALCFFAFVPLWGGYAQFISKDTLYTAALLLFTLQTMEVIGGKADKEPGFWIRYGLVASLACLLRNNGLYVVLPTGLLVVLFGVRGRLRLNAGAALGSAALCVILFMNVLIPALGIRDETASGLYSALFQQSARVLRDHGDRVTREEYAEIDRVLEASRLPELYEPWISDPVKYTFKQYGQGAAAEKAALARYRDVWLSMLGKYPVTYLEAFVAGNSAYYAFTPKMEGETYNNQAGNRMVFETHPQVATHLDVHVSHIAALEGLRVLLAAFARGWRHIPLLSVLYQCAAYTWLLAAAGASLFRARRFRRLIAFVPALLSLATCMLSPVNDYFRYFLPIVAMAPALLVFADEGAGGKPEESQRGFERE